MEFQPDTPNGSTFNLKKAHRVQEKQDRSYFDTKAC